MLNPMEKVTTPIQNYAKSIFTTRSVFDKTLMYLRFDVVLEVSSRSLLEPTKHI